MDGATLGHFTLLEKIGEGGMGRVYKARDSRLERLVAIKLLPESRLADADRRARFVQEAKAASALNHPNIVTIHEISEYEGQTFIVMELVEGKPLTELIPRKGMRLTEALRVAVQVADALAAAHAAGIVHRDLKPANVMVDGHGRAKVLDFGLAKLSAAPAPAATADDATRTMAAAQPRTEEGVILGSVPYMSPEQAEGKAVDARSDIFSFGAVLYEMATGQRAFQGESRASTLAAVVEKEPTPPSGVVAAIPAELERLIVRCIRKDVTRRSQNMTDVKLALEELRDESESGKLAAPGPASPASSPRPRRWVWQAAIIGAAALVFAVIGTYRSRHVAGPLSGPELVRLSPDDGHTYQGPAISPDGKFVAYTSDRGGSRQVWLQQVAGGEPIQVTHSDAPVLGARFFPDGTRLVYGTLAPDTNKSTIEVIPVLGGQARVLATTQGAIYGGIAPDGRQIAYFEAIPRHPWARLMIASIEGGEPHELTQWPRTQPAQSAEHTLAWTSDSRYLLCVGSTEPDGVGFGKTWDWFALPVDGGAPKPTGAGKALRAAGLTLAEPMLVYNGRVLFGGSRGKQENVWEIPFSPASWSASGAPRQLTFGTEMERPIDISASGTLTLSVAKDSTDVYMVPLSPSSGQPTGGSVRLTHDGRFKQRWAAGGEPGVSYFLLDDPAKLTWNGYGVDLHTGKQNSVVSDVPNTFDAIVSPGGHKIAYTLPERDAYSIRVGDAGVTAAAARPICKGCGWAVRFSADERFLFYQPEGRVRPDDKRKFTVRMLELATGKDRPWLEHPADTILVVGTFGEDGKWVTVRVRPTGAQGPTRTYVVPWKEEPTPVSEWIEVKLPRTESNYSPFGNYFLYLQNGKLMGAHFDSKTRTVSEPYEIHYRPGTAEVLKPGDAWGIRGPGLVFNRRELVSSVWLMKLEDK